MIMIILGMATVALLSLVVGFMFGLGEGYTIGYNDKEEENKCHD